MPETRLLVVTHPAARDRFAAVLRPQFPDAGYETDGEQALQALGSQSWDLLILDNALPAARELLQSCRSSFGTVLILLVDEDADFAMPGLADDISTAPLEEGDLVRRARRLLADRQMETLRADAMPPVRSFARRVRKAGSEAERAQAAVSTCLELGFDNAALFRLQSLEPLVLQPLAVESARAADASAPDFNADGLTSLAVLTGRSQRRDASSGAPPAVAVPIGVASRYGVLVASRRAALSDQDVLLVELLAAQLAAIIAKSG